VSNTDKLEVTAPVGFRLEWRPGDYCFYSLENFSRETQWEGACVCGLYSAPQAGCDPAVAVYRGRHWLQPRYAPSAGVPGGFTPLYLGPVLHEPDIDEIFALLFPSFVEPQSR